MTDSDYQIHFVVPTIAVQTISGPPGLNRSQVLALIDKTVFQQDDWLCSALEEGVLENDLADGWKDAVEKDTFNVFDEDYVEVH